MMDYTWQNSGMNYLNPDMKALGAALNAAIVLKEMALQAQEHGIEWPKK